MYSVAINYRPNGTRMPEQRMVEGLPHAAAKKEWAAQLSNDSARIGFDDGKETVIYLWDEDTGQYLGFTRYVVSAYATRS